MGWSWKVVGSVTLAVAVASAVFFVTQYASFYLAFETGIYFHHLDFPLPATHPVTGTREVLGFLGTLVVGLIVGVCLAYLAGRAIWTRTAI